MIGGKKTVNAAHPANLFWYMGVTKMDPQTKSWPQFGDNGKEGSINKDHFIYGRMYGKKIYKGDKEGTKLDVKTIKPDYPSSSQNGVSIGLPIEAYSVVDNWGPVADNDSAWNTEPSFSNYGMHKNWGEIAIVTNQWRTLWKFLV